MCFDKRNVTVLEGDRVNLVVSTSKQLSRAAAVNYVYSNGTGIAATPSPPSRGELYSNNYYAYTSQEENSKLAPNYLFKVI